jgi:hypothetical protein
MQVIYLDHHATTPCDPRVVEKMLPFFTEHFGNAASITHQHGRKSSLAVEDARIAIARFLKVLPPEIYFTAGATESNNIALNVLKAGDHFITGSTEHKSVSVPAERLAKQGVEVTFLQNDPEGFIQPEALREALRPNTRLVPISPFAASIETSRWRSSPPSRASAASSFTPTPRRRSARFRSISRTSISLRSPRTRFMGRRGSVGCSSAAASRPTRWSSAGGRSATSAQARSTSLA